MEPCKCPCVSAQLTHEAAHEGRDRLGRVRLGRVRAQHRTVNPGSASITAAS